VPRPRRGDRRRSTSGRRGRRRGGRPRRGPVALPVRHAGPAGRGRRGARRAVRRRGGGDGRAGGAPMKLSVFTASTPEWTPAEAAAALAAQGWDGVEWRVTDQEDATEPGVWMGNRATSPLTGLAEHLPAIREVARSAGLEF